MIVERGDAQLEVLVDGAGPSIVLLPSLGRGAHDFDPIAERLADAGFRALRPQPRGIGRSTGRWDGLKLEDLAADIWLRVLRALPTFEGDEQGFRGWLYTTARNRLTDWYRNGERRPDLIGY